MEHIYSNASDNDKKQETDRAVQFWVQNTGSVTDVKKLAIIQTKHLELFWNGDVGEEMEPMQSYRVWKAKTGHRLVKWSGFCSTE